MNNTVCKHKTMLLPSVQSYKVKPMGTSMVKFEYDIFSTRSVEMHIFYNFTLKADDFKGTLPYCIDIIILKPIILLYDLYNGTRK